MSDVYRVEPFKLGKVTGFWVMTGEGWEAKTESTFSHHRYGAAAERLARERCEIVNKGLAP